MRYLYRNQPTDHLKRLIFNLSFLLGAITQLSSQVEGNLKYKSFTWTEDSIILDTLSLVPGSVQIRDGNMNLIDTSLYTIRYYSSTIYARQVSGRTIRGKDLKIYYRTYPFNLAIQYKHKDISLVESDQLLVSSPFVYDVSPEREDFFDIEGLNKSGSISRGVSLGSNQDLAVNSNLDLQLSGKLTEDVRILAAISDGNLPIQPEGNTQQLQEFDRVYIQLYNDQYKLIAGDYRMKNEEYNHFLNYNKSLQGGSAEVLARRAMDKNSTLKDGEYYSKVSAAVSKGKFSLNKIQGVEGNQGPYQLRGAENESFIVVISGTEKVYIDGQLLTRGQNFDYVIDYNSAEITFTPNRIITKDKRITVQFQYSDRFYGRSLYHIKTGYRSDKMDLEVNYYNEGDNKNQPLDRDITDDEKQVLSAIGDSLDKAVIPNIILDTNPDISNEILYKLKYAVQPFGPDSFFEYSTDPDSAIWKVGFSFVGTGKGDYILASSDANGKVFQFVPRDLLTGAMGGSYMPLTIIVTPKRRQMLTVGGRYDLTGNSSLTYEMALTSNDANTRSSADDGDNNGAGFLVRQDNSLPLSSDPRPLKLDIGGSYELVSRQFQEIERFRTVEFYRDWNLPQPTGSNPKGLENQQQVAEVYAGFSRLKVGKLRYSVSTFQDQNTYQGLNNKVEGTLNRRGFDADFRGSYLNSSGEYESDFLRHHTSLSKKVTILRAGLEYDEERSRVYNEGGDSLDGKSFRWNWWQAYITNSDSSDNNYKLSYLNRYDYAVGRQTNAFKRSTFAEEFGFELWLQGNPRHQFLSKVTYRKLRILDTLITDHQPEENILGKIDYQGLLLRQLITWQTYYEVGSGLEIKREVVFEGPLDPGQGNYVWKDLNDDGVRQKTEFFVAPTTTEGIYNRVLLPTNEYQRAYTNIFNQVIFLKPEILLSAKRGFLKMLSYLSDRFTYRIDKKSNRKNVYYPLNLNFEKDSLLSLNNSFLNTFYINRLGTVFGVELNYRENNNRNLYISGKESRYARNRGIRTRWNITRKFTLNTEYEEGKDRAISENFSNRNFNLMSQAISPEFFFQPGIAFRLGLNYKYQVQNNSEEFGGQEAVNNDFGTEIRYNVAQKGSFQLNINFILIRFSGNEDPTLLTEMLEGLQPGKNATWNLLYQRNLGKYVQMSLNYSGRQSEGSRVVHLGGAQVRAFF